MDLANDGNTGSVTDLLGGDAGAGTGGDAGAAATGGDAVTGGDAGGQGGGDIPADFLALFPAETPEGETASLQDWVKASGVKDAATLAKIARDNQKALRESGRIKVPGEGATAQEVAEYRQAIGVPDAATGYQLPEIKDADGNPIPLNTPVAERIFAKAHELGGPKTLVEQLVASEIQAQIEEHDAAVKQITADAQKHINGWGAEKEQGLVQVNAALKELGFSRKDVEHMRAMPGGVGKFLDAMRKVGSNFTEDTLIRGDRQTFGMTAEQAQSEIDAMKADPEQVKKVMVPGSSERIKWDRLNAVLTEAASKAA
jgi:hypothetical protein